MIYICVVAVSENSTCPLLGYIRNGNRAYIHGRPGEVGSVVQFACYKGSRLLGEQILTCKPDFTWDYPVPTCISKCQKILVQNRDVQSCDVSTSTKLVRVQDFRLINDISRLSIILSTTGRLTTGEMVQVEFSCKGFGLWYLLS